MYIKLRRNERYIYINDEMSARVGSSSCARTELQRLGTSHTVSKSRFKLASQHRGIVMTTVQRSDEWQGL